MSAPMRSGRGPRRRGAAMVAVLMTLLVAAGLAAALLGRAGGARRKLGKLEDHLQRQLALDAAFTHALHDIKDFAPTEGRSFSDLKAVEGEGAIGGVPYAFQAQPDPSQWAVTITAQAGEPGGPGLEGVAEAYLVHEVRKGRPNLRWAARYHGAKGRR